jgi:RHS repeat-associated protein
MARRPGFTDRRRARLARRIAALEVMEPRSMIIDSFGIMLGVGLPTAAWIGTSLGGEAEVEAPPRPLTAPDAGEDLVALRAAGSPPDGSAAQAGDWLAFVGSIEGDEAARGVAGEAESGRGLITPLTVPPPAQAAGGPVGQTGQADAAGPTGPASPAPTPVASAPAPVGIAPGDVSAIGGVTTLSGATLAGAGAVSLRTSSGFQLVPVQSVLSEGEGEFELLSFGNGGMAFSSFANFPLYTLDMNHGVILFDGMAQIGYAGVGGEGGEGEGGGGPAVHVDLRAQVRDVTVASYEWDTTGMTHATNFTGDDTYNLQFDWNTEATFPEGVRFLTDTLTLTVTDSEDNTETQTYTFIIPRDDLIDEFELPTWPATLAPDLVQAASPAFASHYVDVTAATGALEAYVGLPSYSPNFGGLVFAYDSLAADPRPIVVVNHELDPAEDTPDKTSAQLTFNSVAGSTYYYDTSEFTPGDFAQFSLQKAATALATGRYYYSVTVVDDRTTNTTTTYTGTTTVLNPADEPFASLGTGWSLGGLNKLYAVTSGVILSSGSGDSLWFATGSSSGGTTSYTSPAGDFTALTKNDSSGAFTRTLPDGTKQEFNPGGYQTAAVDRNGLRVTYAYSSNRLTTITDPYAKVTTFSYSGGALSTVEDPANRVTTFTHSGGALTGVTLPDGSAWAYGYDSGGRMTSLTDPRSKTVTVAYDDAKRVGTITRPDSTTQSFDAYQVRGFDTSGTSMSPAPAILLAEATALHTDPRGNSTGVRLDWRGLGVAGQGVDADGYVATRDVDADGLAMVSIDRVNRLTRDFFDGQGNVTKHIHGDGRADAYTYNGFAQVLTHTNPRSFTTQYTYDGEGNLTSVVDALTNRTTITYTANGRVESVKDARNNLTTYQYDSQDRVTTVTFPGGATNLIAYDSKGNAATLTDERGNSTTFSYDALNRRTGMTDALSNRTTYQYDSGGNRTVVQAPLSRTTTFAYNNMNRVTTVTDPLSHSTVIGYDSGGNVRTVTDPLSRVTTYEYDSMNRPTVVIDPLAQRATTTYNAEGQVIQIADRLNRITTISYNSRGLRHTVTDPLGRTVTYSYSPTGRPSSVSEPAEGEGEIFEAYDYDALDRLESVSDALGHRTTTVYDAVGNPIARVDANNHRTTFTLDNRDRFETVVDALSHVTTFVYDSGGNRTVVIDPLGNRTTTAYDALDRATTITDAESGVTTITYDAVGRRTGLTDPVGNRTTWSYDAADRLTTMTDALGTATYSYDNANQLTDQTDIAGRRTTFSYDSGGRQTRERWLDGSGGTIRTITFTYDAESQSTSVSDPDATLTFTYDSGGRQLTERTSGGGTNQPDVTLTKTYNEFGDRASLTDNLGSVGRTTYVYDAARRLTDITRTFNGSNEVAVGFDYDDANRLTRVQRTASGSNIEVRTTFAYDAANRVTTILHQAVEPGEEVGQDGPITGLVTYSYGYDSANRLTTETIDGSTVTYGYDATSQLTSARGARTEDYGYDANGNRDTTGYTVSGGNRMTASPGATYTYDPAGNVSAKTETGTGRVTTFSYDYRNRLTGVTRKDSGGSVIMQATYTYDPLDRRIGTRTDDDGAGPNPAVQTWTAYDGVNTYADFDGAGSLRQRYLYGPAIDELLARTGSGGTTAWYLVDRLGTVRDVASTAGTVIYHASYDSYGNITGQSGGGGDRFRFTGREYDVSTGLYYYRARYYDPVAGRFVSCDPIGFSAGDANLYRYVFNGPILFTDPTGEIVPVLIIGGVVLIGGLFWDPTPANAPDLHDPTYPARSGDRTIRGGYEAYQAYRDVRDKLDQGRRFKEQLEMGARRRGRRLRRDGTEMDVGEQAEGLAGAQREARAAQRESNRTQNDVEGKSVIVDSGEKTRLDLRREMTDEAEETVRRLRDRGDGTQGGR